MRPCQLAPSYWANTPMPISEPETIRRASLADAADLASVHVTSWHETYTGMVPATMLSSLSVEGRRAIWQQILSASTEPGSTNVYVAQSGRSTVGFGACCSQRTQTLRERGYDGEISAIYVLSGFQRRAIGRRLLFALASDLLARDFGAASLWVLRDNAVARRFYERYGAQLVAEREDARADGVLLEVAYGWTHLAELARLAAGRSIS